MRVEDLKVGDMVSCKMDAVLMNVTHRGIYVGYTAQEGRHSVVHNFCGEGKKKQGGGDGGVMIWSMAKFKEYAIGGWWVENGPTPYTGEQIAQRALSRVGERNYHTMSNNCEHFAYWCRYNAANSPQVIGSIAMPLVPVVKVGVNTLFKANIAVHNILFFWRPSVPFLICSKLACAELVLNTFDSLE